MSMRGRQRAEQAAAALLVETSVDRVPVPVADVAKACGARITYQPFDADDISGLLYRQPGEPAIIGVNSANSGQRQRFTIAHELGHLRLHKGHELILDRLVRVNFRDAASSTATDAQEIEANAFAAALLMPQPRLQQRLDALVTGRPLSDAQLTAALAQAFDVSRQAMEYRLINLGLLSPGG